MEWLVARAEGEIGELVEGLTTEIQSNLFDVLPYVLGVAAVIISITLAYRLFRKFVSR